MDYIFILHLKILCPPVGCVYNFFLFEGVDITVFFFIQPEINESYLDLESVSCQSVWIASWPSGLR